MADTPKLFGKPGEQDVATAKRAQRLISDLEPCEDEEIACGGPRG